MNDDGEVKVCTAKSEGRCRYRVNGPHFYDRVDGNGVFVSGREMCEEYVAGVEAKLHEHEARGGLRKGGPGGAGSAADDWSNPEPGTLLVTATPARTHDSNVSFYGKFAGFDRAMRGVGGALPVRNTMGMWDGKLERSRVYATPDPGPDGIAALRGELDKVRRDYLQDSVMVMRADPNGKSKLLTVDGLTAEQALDATTWMKACYALDIPEPAPGHSAQPVPALFDIADPKKRKLVADSCGHELGGTYADGRLMVAVIDKYQGDSPNHDKYYLDLFTRHVLKRRGANNVSETRVSVDMVESDDDYDEYTAQQKRGDADNIRLDKQRGLIRGKQSAYPAGRPNKYGDAPLYYSPAQSNTINQVKEWMNDGEQRDKDRKGPHGSGEGRLAAMLRRHRRTRDR
ncbi:hypothetical protein EMO89_00485 [Bifidobacterium tissieri]|uniref:Uncharacterized protein n=1 Tax=Bifidobacterium tissieri TaxID=1630162 RepID=A0A5M9ZX73_9BIFI|nr:hypothetical protein [Bifidobacterium tissieri]KAA8832039.1 hypothetical protein EMO89_00485 [Bifidobacterium tissieri]